MSTVKEKESPRRKAALASAQRSGDAVASCVLLGLEPSGKIAFAQLGEADVPAEEQVTDAILDRYPNLAYVALIPAQVVSVRQETGRVHRPK